MKLHTSTITELIRIVETHGGHRDERRLRTVLANLDLSTYKQTSTGKQVLVLTKALDRETGN